MPLTKAQILSANDTQKELVEVPEWGGSVWVYGLTARQRDQFEAGNLKQKKGQYEVCLEDARARLCVLAIRDEAGSRLFNDLEIRDLSAKSAAALDRVYSVAARLSGIKAEDVEKNSEPTPGDDSSSPSPGPSGEVLTNCSTPSAPASSRSGKRSF